KKIFFFCKLISSFCTADGIEQAVSKNDADDVQNYFPFCQPLNEAFVKYTCLKNALRSCFTAATTAATATDAAAAAAAITTHKLNQTADANECIQQTLASPSRRENRFAILWLPAARRLSKQKRRSKTSIASFPCDDNFSVYLTAQQENMHQPSKETTTAKKQAVKPSFNCKLCNVFVLTKPPLSFPSCDHVGRRRSRFSSITLDNIGNIHAVLKNLIRIDSQERLERSREKLTEFYNQKRRFLNRCASITSANREELQESLRLQNAQSQSRSQSLTSAQSAQFDTSQPLLLNTIHENRSADSSSLTRSASGQFRFACTRRRSLATSECFWDPELKCKKAEVVLSCSSRRRKLREDDQEVRDDPKTARLATNVPIVENAIQGNERYSSSRKVDSAGVEDLRFAGIRLRPVSPRRDNPKKHSVNQTVISVQLRRTVAASSSVKLPVRKWQSVDLGYLMLGKPKLLGRLLWLSRGEEEEEPEVAEESGSEEDNAEEDDAEVEHESEEEKPRPKPKYSIDDESDVKVLNEAEKAMLAAKKKHEEEEASKLREYEEQRRIQREREEEELKHEDYYFIQERRRREREEEERILAERRREEEERRKQEEEDRKRRAEDDKRRKEEEKKKRQQMMAGLNASTGPNFQIAKKDKNTEKFDKFGNIVKAKAEMGLTKEQQEEQKRKFLAELVKPLSTQGLDIQGLRSKIKEFHQRICRLEADKYDLEKRGERQDYDLKELNERQRQISRNKALKKGLDPEEAANSRHPPKVPIASKYDRQIDRRSYSDRRHLFENPKVPVTSKYDRQIDRRSFHERKLIFEVVSVLKRIPFLPYMRCRGLAHSFLKPNALPHFPNTPVSLLILEKIHQDVKTNDADNSDVDFTFTVQSSKEVPSQHAPLKKKQQPIFHGSARPPLKWGRKENEELENLRRNLEPPKYIEQVKVEGARPPMEPIPVQMPDVYENGSVWHEFPDQKMLSECYGDNFHGNIFFNKIQCKQNVKQAINLIEKAQKLQFNHNGLKIGVLISLPSREDNFYVVQFITFIYASWKYVNEHKFEVVNQQTVNSASLNLIDLLVFCMKSSCSFMPPDCIVLQNGKMKTADQAHRNLPTCYIIPTEEFKHRYSSVNSYAFLNAPEVSDLEKQYDYFIRTDIDSFLSPALLLFKLDNETPIITGHGGYCTAYTTHRLHALAKRLQLNHQKIHCPGSTWFGKSDVIIKLANLSAHLAMIIYDNEFDAKKYPELRPFFKNSAFGQWPEWWKPVSSMYAQELALNHLIKNFTTHFIQKDLLDVESCRQSSIFNHLHIHTWHDDCEFQKFKFLNPIVANLTHGRPVFLRTENAFPKLAKCMSVKEYCTHIAWNGLYRYFSFLAKTSPYFKD
ncbi:Troponin T, partial [Trichinella zimbabwensis]